MDIIDILLARAMTPQGQTENYVNVANAAAVKAAKAKDDAEEAIATVNAAASDIEEKQSAAEELLSTAQNVLETAQQAQIAMPNAYSTTGQNTDGYMTQKAVTDALDTKASVTYVNNSLSSKVDNSTLNNYATTAYVNQQIAAIPQTPSIPSGVSNLGVDNAGKIVIIGEDGNIISGIITQNDIIEALIQTGEYVNGDIIGLAIDYENKSFSRIQSAAGKSMGSDFNSYTMYGGRMRCNVADDGTINAFYGDNNYRDDGSNGQVMIYQPKFYYQRNINKTSNGQIGKIIRQETIMITSTPISGFKLHPLFKLSDGTELDYVLLPAYDATIENNTLTSKAGTKPSSGMTVMEAEAYATNRGAGWHITNLAAESANQMLEIIEFGMMNGQEAIEAGISNITSNTTYNCSSITGSTSTLGNSSGTANSTINEINGSTTSYSTVGQRAISYRGMENPWGNIWHMIGGINIQGSGASGSGIPYICSTFNYSDQITADYHSIGFCLPVSYGWISAMGYGNEEYDWVYMPAECNQANSALPVGDNLWATQNLNGINAVALGGGWYADLYNGPFYYGCDRSIQETSRTTYGAHIMFIPTKNNIYTANINKWQQKNGG